MKTIPHYRRNFRAGHNNQNVTDLLTNVYIAGLQRMAKPGEFETYADLFAEVDYLLALTDGGAK